MSQLQRALFAALLFLLLAATLTLAKPNQATGNPQILGASTGDSLHPIEVYFGPPGVLSLPGALKRLGVEVFPEDRVSVFPNLELGLGAKITIERATPIFVDDGGTLRVLRTWSSSVSELLAEKQIALGPQDILEPSYETLIAWGLKLTITRVEEVEEKVQEAIAFSTLTQKDPSLDRCQKRLLQKGRPGTREKTYLLRLENGREVARKLLASQVIKEPEIQIVAQGTKVTILGAGTATWYPVSGLVAAHNSLPRGTKVEVVNKNNGKSVIVTIVGPGIKTPAVIDLSPEAMGRLITDLYLSPMPQVELRRACGQ